MSNEETELVLSDKPAEGVLRLTLNRPAKRNALSNALRSDLFQKMRAGDLEPEVRVMVIRGAGPCFSAGYDLAQDPSEPLPRHTAPVDGYWPRHLVEGWFEMWDYATPVIAQVHGYCLAGGSELAAACDLAYVAEDATIGYPAIRMMGTPDMVWQPWLLGFRKGMEALLTGDSMTGTEAAAAGFANRAVPAAELDEYVALIASRIAQVPAEFVALNKRAMHRSMETMGIRTALHATTEFQALSFHQRTHKAYRRKLSQDVTGTLTERDEPFADYRTVNSS